jgi:hypothetical protein
MLPFGNVIQYVKEGTGILLIMPFERNSIFDIDNIICLPENFNEQRISKLVIGFVSDVIGPVTMPMYTVCLMKNLNYKLSEISRDTKDGNLKKYDIENPCEFWKSQQICLV